MPASIALIIATFLWGSSFIALKYAINIYDPSFVIFFRMLITLILCITLWRWVKKFTYQQGDWKYLLSMSIAEPCLYYLFEGNAMKYTSASQAGVLVSCFPLLVAIVAYLMLKEKVTKRIAIGFSFCIGGGVLLTLVSETSSQAPNPALGNFLEFLAMVCAAYYAVSVKHLSQRYSPLSLIALQGLAGSIFFAPFLLFIEIPPVHDITALIGIFYLGAFVTIGAYGMYNYAITKVSVLTAAAFTNLIPIFTLLLSAIILGESLTVHQWGCILLVFIGVYISQKKTRKSLLS
ncbi:DMT family transporter [Litorilituus lipolyticus]|uniref:DMT family transporter n=1 Tax=Litorilituus lipolyticus TaxID=2491017 RepID=A0A502L8U8_9GAMM|nr:DMT family transporter [Litorilituus lipolyticus]TPH18483.1 DMT family transporter [Litorilituus lipolyticus]